MSQSVPDWLGKALHNPGPGHAGLAVAQLADETLLGRAASRCPPRPLPMAAHSTRPSRRTKRTPWLRRWSGRHLPPGQWKWR